MDNEARSNGESGVQRLLVPVMTITVDLQTGLPSFKCTELPVALWQMWVGEVQRQLEETRRKGAALALQQELAANKKAAELAAALGLGGKG